MHEMSHIPPETILRFADRFARSCGEGFTIGTCILSPDELPLFHSVRVRVRFAYPGILHVALQASGQHLVSSLPGRPLQPARPRRRGQR